MKTLIATLALTLAASTAAIAGDSIIADRGVPAALQYDYSVSSVQVSGFTGVADFTNINSDPSEAGRPLSLQPAYEGSNMQVSGFTGINADVVVLEDPLAGKGGNR